MAPPLPPWLEKARQFAARVSSPVGKPFAAAKKGKVCDVYIYDAIGKDPWTGEGVSPDDIVQAMKDAKGSDELAVHVNSPGGYVFDGLAIYNAIRAFEGKKTVYVDGVAASIASVIALAGDNVVTNHGAMWMVHDPSGGIFSFGTADQIEDDARKTVAALRKVRENLVDIYTSATGRPVSEVSAWMTGETWMTAQEALDRGFTDEIAQPMPMEPDEMPEHEDRAMAQVSPRVKVAAARATARVLSEKFAASRDPKNPGQPGTTRHAPSANAEKGR